MQVIIITTITIIIIILINKLIIQLMKIGYRPGAIIRVNMKNFLTYDNCEVFPGPKLNVVLGPNGTGKSTVTHAICLACGGEPKVLGRSNELSQFVKHGKQGEEAFAEVDILDENSVQTIRRTIHSESNTSKWKVNGANATKDQVRILLKTKLKIDVDNLCTFMSQDKVGLFTQQTPVGILKMTLQCIAIKDTDRTLLDEQTELATHEKAKGDQERDLTAKQSTFDKKVSELSKLEAEVANVRQRQEKKELLKKYEVKKTVVQAKKDRDTLRVKSDALEKAKQEKEAEEQKIHPLQEAERDAKRKLDQHDATSKSLVGKYKGSEDRVSEMKLELKKASQASQDIVVDLDEFENNRKLAERKLADARARAKKAEADHAKAVEKVPAIESKLKQLNEEIQLEKEVEENLEEEIKEIANKIGELNGKKNSLNSRVQKHQDSTSAFKAKLKTWADRFKDKVVTNALKIFEHIHTNKEAWKQQKKLKGEVYGPAAYYMQVDDISCAVILEKAINRNTLLSCYITEHIDDERFLKAEMVKLGQSLRDRDLRADYYTVTNITDEKSQRPFDRRYLDRFKGIGLLGYLGDTFQTNDVVRGYFADRTAISKTLWCRGSTDKITDQLLTDLCGNEGKIILYVQNDKDKSITEFNISKQRYDIRSPPVINSQQVPQYNNILGLNSDNTAQKEQLLAELQEVKQQIHALEKEWKEKKEKLMQIAEPLNDKRQQVKSLKEALRLPTSLGRDLVKAQREVLDLEKGYKVNAEEDRRDLLSQYQERFKTIVSLVQQVVKEGEQGMRFQLEKMAAEETRSSLKQSSEEASQQVRNAMRALESFTSTVREARKEYDDFLKVQQASQASVEAMIQELGGQQMFKPYYAAISAETGDATELEDIIDRIETLRAEIDAGVDNDGLLVHYQRLVQEVASDKIVLEELQRAFNNAEESLVNRSAEWKNSVMAISERINASFSDYMKKLQYEGEAELRDHGAFDQYAMNMKVSFRANSKLSDLDGSRHSGGERAVSTIMYLMALQELTSAPFRVVDEINQGMDERNERLVFDRIVDSCCGDDSKPQYFLVSPKLLQGLARMDNKDVTVLLVLNGPGVPRSLPCIQDVIEHVKEAKRRKLK